MILPKANIYNSKLFDVASVAGLIKFAVTGFL